MMTEPIDRLHEECMFNLAEIRSDFVTAHSVAAEWTLSPCPPLPPRVYRQRSMTAQQLAWHRAYDNHLPDVLVKRGWFR